MVELNQAGLVEMDAGELKNLDGGWVVPVLVGAGISLANNWSDFIDGISAGYAAMH